MKRRVWAAAELRRGLELAADQRRTWRDVAIALEAAGYPRRSAQGCSSFLLAHGAERRRHSDGSIRRGPRPLFGK